MNLQLAQLVDALPDLNWTLVAAIGPLAPLAGLLLSVALYGFRRRRSLCVSAFYAAALPLALLVIVGQTENPLVVCSFLILLPVGILLGIGVSLPLR